MVGMYPKERQNGVKNGPTLRQMAETNSRALQKTIDRFRPGSDI
jgi:hypothetical protein